MQHSHDYILRSPTLEDGIKLHRLVESCPPLDTNSSYCNLLQCSHFAATSVVIESNGDIVGAISGYLVPERPDTLFIWQVAVCESMRGLGLALKMVHYLIGQTACNAVSYIETTITEDNTASWKLFDKVAALVAADMDSSVWMDKTRHFAGQHASEKLVRIGPIKLSFPHRDIHS